MQFPVGGPGVPQRPGSAAPGAPTPAQMAQMQAALANPAFAAQFAAHQQALMAQRMAAAAAAQAANPSAAARAGAPAASKPAAGAAKGGGAGGGGAAAVEAVPAKKSGPGRKRKAADQRLPDRGDLLIPDSPLFTQLQDAERRVDMLVSRKRHELQEMMASFKRGPPGSAAAAGSARRRLRVYVRSEHQHQRNAPDAAEPPSWVLTISGRLVGKDRAADADEGGPAAARQPFTHYVRRLRVQLDPDGSPGGGGVVAWDKAAHDREPRDAVQLRRLGGAPCEALISLELDHQPAQYRPSAPLAAALGLRGLHSLPFVLQMLWGYIKARQLYEPSDKGPVCVRCDAPLRAVFGADSVELGRLADALKPHLAPPDPVQLRYTIRPDGPAVAHPDCYDFEVEVPLSSELPPYVLKAGAGREAEQLDGALHGVLARLAEHRRRRALLLAFAQDPADFVQALVAAQGRDLRLAATREGEAYELLAAGDVFRERWVDDCVLNYMMRRQSQQAAEQQQAQMAAVAQQRAAAAVAQQAAAAGAGGMPGMGGVAGMTSGAPTMSLQQQAAAHQALQQQIRQQQAAAAAAGGLGGGGPPGM